MTTLAIIAAILIALASFVAECIRLAKEDDDTDDDHSDYAELRCVTTIFANNQKIRIGELK